MAKTAQTQYLIESAIFTADRRPDLPIIKPIEYGSDITLMLENVSSRHV